MRKRFCNEYMKKEIERHDTEFIYENVFWIYNLVTAFHEILLEPTWFCKKKHIDVGSRKWLDWHNLFRNVGLMLSQRRLYGFNGPVIIFYINWINLMNIHNHKIEDTAIISPHFEIFLCYCIIKCKQIYPLSHIKIFL